MDKTFSAKRVRRVVSLQVETLEARVVPCGVPAGMPVTPPGLEVALSNCRAGVTPGGGQPL